MRTRTAVVASIAGLIAVGAAAAAYAVTHSGRMYEPEVRIRNESYAEVRKTFRTHLLRESGSPQREVFVLHPPEYVEAVDYPSGTLRLKAWLTRDRVAGHKLPAVLFLHGGFEFGAADWDMAVPYWEAGFVVMAPMLRGENGQPGTFSFLYDEVDDVLAAAAFLAQQPGVDPDRIYVAGHSAGATLALLAIEASPRFRAAVSFDASPDQQLLYNGSASKPGSHREVVFDTKDSAELEVRSPLAFVSSVQRPVRLFYSNEAAPLNRRSSERFVALLRPRGVDAIAMRVWGSHMSHVSRAMPWSIEFFKHDAGAEARGLLARRTVPPLAPSLRGNTTFTLAGHETARVVALAGSFNGWDSQHVLFGKENGRWVCRVDLPPGRYFYQFVVDDEWITDPGNPTREDGGTGSLASVIEKKP